LNRDDLDDSIPLFVQLLEASLDRHEATRYERENDITLSTSPAPLPEDCRELLSLRYNDGTNFGPIDIRTPEQLPRYRQAYGLTGVPRAVAVISNGESLELAPVPDVSLVAKGTYITKLVKLTSGLATSNWLLLGHPDIYFYGSLVHSAPFLKNDERIMTWQGFYDKGLAELDALIKRRNFGGNTPRVRPHRVIG